MAAGDPIPLGVGARPKDALSTAGLGSVITTDEFGVQSGTIRHFCGDQSQGQALRPQEGSAYGGALPQFKGFLVDYSGDVAGEEGKSCYLDVTYCAIDPRFVIKAEEDTELRWINSSDSAFVSDIVTFGRIGLPEPVVTIKYADTKRCELTKSTSLYSATDSFRSKMLPPITPFRFVAPRYSLLVGWNPASPTPGVPLKNVKKFGDLYYRVLYYFRVFNPHELGWQLTKVKQNKRAGGKIWAIEENWRTFYQAAGVEGPFDSYTEPPTGSSV